MFHNANDCLTGVPRYLLSAMEGLNVAVVAPDYRLAPQAKLPDILRDCVSLMECLRSCIFKQIVSSKLDASRICVAGASAGRLSKVFLTSCGMI